MATAQQVTQVTQLYAALFVRAPDATGLGYWVDQMATSGKTFEQIAVDMYNTTPARTYYPLFLTNDEIVTVFYTNTLGRAPDADGLAYWSAQLTSNSVGKIITDMITAVTNWTAGGTDPALDALGTESQGLFNNKVDVGEYFATVLRSDDLTLAESALTGVTSDPASVDTVNATNAAAVNAAAVTSFTLTTGVDTISGGTGDDLITGGLGTLSNVDEIHGGAGTDTLTVSFAPELATAGAATAAAPVISGVEILNISSRSNSAQLNFTDIKGVTALNVGGNYNLNLNLMPNTLTAIGVNGMSATLTIDQATATASTAAYGLTLNMSASTAATVIWLDDSASTALLDTITLNALNDVTLGSASNFSGAEKIVLQGNGAVNINMVSAAAGGMQSAALGDLTANNTAAGIDASGLSGNLTLDLDSVSDINIKGGAGNDTFNMTANLNTNDTLAGGAGTDTLNAILTGGYFRPIISGVEILNFQGNATAITADLRDVAGATTLNLMLASAIVVDKAQTSMSTISINSSNASGNDLTVRYGTAAAASDVTLNLGNGVQADFQTAAATATAMALGDISMSGNSGSLTVKAVSTANYSIDTVSAADFTAVTLDAASANMTISAAQGVTLANAQTVTLNAAAGKSIVNVGIFSAMAANTLSFNANGASALIDLSAVQVGTANTMTITTNSAATGGLGFSAVEMNFQSAAAATGALNLDTLTINALGGDVTIECAQFLSGATAINLSIGVTMGSTAVAVTINNLVIDGIATAATASEQNLSLTLAGTGSFTLASAAITTANLTFAINATALASGSNVTIDLSTVNASSVVSAIFGANTGSFVGGDGADNIEAGVGAMTLDGGLGADTITLNTTAASTVKFSAAHGTALNGLDTIGGAGAGDIILFAALNLSAPGGSAIQTGTATTAVDFNGTKYTAVTTGAQYSALDRIQIYTSNGDTIIDVLNLTGGGGTAGEVLSAGAMSADAQFIRVTLSNKDFTAITAAFRIETGASGLSVTLL